TRRRAGDLVGVATHDIELIEYFFAHTVTPAFVAILVPTVVLVTLAVFGWPMALAVLPFLAWAGASPVLARRRIDDLGSRARAAGAWPLAVFGGPRALAVRPFLAWAGASPVLARRRIDDLGSRAREVSGDLNAHAVDTVQGLAEIVAFQRTESRGEEFASK